MLISVDIFMEHVKYISFTDVINLCSTNRQLRSYGTKYNIHWKALINTVYSDIHYYDEYLEEIWVKLKLPKNTYNYIVYTKIIDMMDPITQLSIYYYKDFNIFKSKQYTNTQRSLSLILLNKPICESEYNEDASIIYRFLSNKYPFHILNEMLIIMAREGSIKGVEMILNKGSNISTNYNNPIRWAIFKGNIKMVKYLFSKGVSIKHLSDGILIQTAKDGYYDVIKYLFEHGVKITSNVLNEASRYGHIKIVKYLCEIDDRPNRWDLDESFLNACKGNSLEVVKYLLEKGADIHYKSSEALGYAYYNGNLDMINLLRFN